MTNATTARRLLPAAVLLAALALVAGCGGSSDNSQDTGSTTSSPAGADAHNSADVTFATDMIPHHAQAVEMADLAASKATDAEVKSLAAAIKGAQDPEIKTMTGWLKDWDAPVPETGMGHEMSAGSEMGMMTAEEMSALEKSSGAEFDKMWVEMMTRHHNGAIEMAKTEIKSGQYAPAKALAQRIVSAQTSEVATLKGIASRLA